MVHGGWKEVLDFHCLIFFNNWFNCAISFGQYEKRALLENGADRSISSIIDGCFFYNLSCLMYKIQSYSQTQF